MTENLESRLRDGSQPWAGPGLFRLQGPVTPDDVAWVTEAAGWMFIHIDAADVRDKREFLAVAGEALRFPEWSGHNWDAFEELVNDLSWLPPVPGYVVLVDHLTNFANAHPKDLATAVDILHVAAENRLAVRGVPMIVLLRGASRAARRAPVIELTPEPETPGE